MGSPRHTTAALAAPISALALLAGCRSSFEIHREDIRRLAERGDYAHAAAVLDEPCTQRLYGDKNRLLYLLDRGGVALALGDDAETIALLERAEAMMEVYRKTAGDEIAQWLINDTAAPYRGEPYEDLYVNVLKLLAQLEAGNIEGGATVEARRLATKADVLRDRYLVYSNRVKEEADPRIQSRLGSGGGWSGGGGLVTHNEEGRFVESTLGTYLTAVTFMEAGDRSNQGVAARRLIDSIRLQSEIVGPADPADFEDLGERRADDANLLVVALSGAAPYKVAQRFGPIVIVDWPIYFELPVLVPGEQHAAGARVIVAPAPSEAGAQALDDQSDASSATDASKPAPGGPTGIAPEPAAETYLSYELSFVEDLSSVAQENHEREMPFIYARTLIRASAKALGSFAATQAVRGSTDNDLAVIGSIIGGLLFVGLTEKADLRSWIFLPGRADVGLIDLPPGLHRIRIEYLAPGGGVIYTSPWEDIAVPEDGLATVVGHYWE